MRIRTGLIVALVLVGLVPVLGFTWFTHKQSLAQEFTDVNDRHLLLAKNLSAALSRYERDVRATVDAVAIALEEIGGAGAAQGLLKTLNIRSVALLDAQSGATRASVSTATAGPPEQFPDEVLRLAKAAKAGGPLKYSTVYRSEDAFNRMYVYGRRNDNLVVARMSTEYFVSTGGHVAFGEKGHAAIVDHKGNILAHPLDGWIKSAKNIAKVSSVQRMLRGETGVEQFYSPALKGDMIAGLTSVAGPGWGVMIPQPVSELHARALSNIMPLLMGLAITVVLGLILFQLSLRWVARPLENLNRELSNQLLKGMPSQVPPSKSLTLIYELTNIVEAYNRLASEVLKTAQQLSDKALQDPVTGIGNRAYFSEFGQQQIKQRIAASKNGVLILTDLDGFKEINDTRGHEVGDQFLHAYAQGLYASTKRFMDREFRGLPGAHPIIGRIGGDEFAILLPVPHDDVDLNLVGSKLLKELPTLLQVEGVAIPCAISAGGAAYPLHGTTIDKLLRRADVALYTSKVNGKNQFTLYDKKNALGGKSEILSAVADAISNDELVLEYQPKFCLTKNKVTGVEALLRWNHPRLGRIYPDTFLPAVQQTHLMVKLGDWVVDRAMADINRLDSMGHDLKVAVNIGLEHFSETDFAESLQDACLVHGFDPKRLQLEVTEDVMDQTQGTFVKTVSQLQQDGFTVAIDDFGKGFSNLSRMALVPTDVIKLDRSLVCEAENHPRFRTVMKSAVDMAHALGAAVVVEGVETFESVKMAQETGADALQGFYFTRALPVSELSRWLGDFYSSEQYAKLQPLAKARAAA